MITGTSTATVPRMNTCPMTISSSESGFVVKHEPPNAKLLFLFSLAALVQANHPDVDSGLHLTLTSEWNLYRWPPLAGKPKVPGLVDEEGCLWSGQPYPPCRHSSPVRRREWRLRGIGRAKRVGNFRRDNGLLLSDLTATRSFRTLTP